LAEQKKKKIVAIDPNDQTILVNWYNSLIFKGSLHWNVANDLCGQTGVTCDNSSPKRVIKLYSIFGFILCSLFQNTKLKIEILEEINSMGQFQLNLDI